MKIFLVKPSELVTRRGRITQNNFSLLFKKVLTVFFKAVTLLKLTLSLTSNLRQILYSFDMSKITLTVLIRQLIHAFCPPGPLLLIAHKCPCLLSSINTENCMMISVLLRLLSLISAILAYLIITLGLEYLFCLSCIACSCRCVIFLQAGHADKCQKIKDVK